MTSVCSEVRDQLGAFALGALDALEHARLQQHLQTCAHCREELAGYQLVAEGLLHMAPAIPPPARVRARLIARLARPQARRWGRGRSPLSLKPTLAASLVVLVLLNLALLWQNRSLALQQQDLLAQVEANRTALAMLSYPEAETVRVQGEGGRGLLIYDPQGELAVLSIWDLPELPKGQAYQAWLIEPSGERVSAGLFIPERGKPISILLHSPYPLRDFVGFGVTIEPAGGSAGPTGPRVLAADL